MRHLKSMEELKNLYKFEDEDLSIRKPEADVVVEEPFVQKKQFDPSKDTFKHKVRDLTKSNSISGAIQPMIQELQPMISDRANAQVNLLKMKNKVLSAINDVNVFAKPETRRKWTMSVEKTQSLIELASLMTNLCLGGAGLSKAAFDKKGLPF